jgi:hypothetical protein
MLQRLPTVQLFCSVDSGCRSRWVADCNKGNQFEALLLSNIVLITQLQHREGSATITAFSFAFTPAPSHRARERGRKAVVNEICRTLAPHHSLAHPQLAGERDAGPPAARAIRAKPGTQNPHAKPRSEHVDYRAGSPLLLTDRKGLWSLTRMPWTSCQGVMDNPFLC